MLIPRAELRRELENCSLFIRLFLTTMEEETQAGLVVKAHSHLLKELVARNIFSLTFGEITESGPGICAIKIDDGGEMPYYIWSILHKDEEVQAIRRFRETGRCNVYLFNETSVNVVSAYGVEFLFGGQEAPSMNTTTAVLEDELTNEGQLWIYEAMLGMTPALYAEPTAGGAVWKETLAIYHTDAGQRSILSIVSGDEGDQQEELALWITENLEVGPVRSPQAVRNGKGRELIDILFVYSDGAVLIESKSLMIVPEPVSRAQLARRVSKAVDKGIDQLGGACRRIFGNGEIVGPNNAVIQVPKEHALHCIALVPDLSLLEDRADLDSAFFNAFLANKSGYLHVLDTTELASLVHSALYLSQNSAETTPIMAFDAVLFRRWNIVNEKNSINVAYLVKIKGSD